MTNKTKLLKALTTILEEYKADKHNMHNCALCKLYDTNCEECIMNVFADRVGCCYRSNCAYSGKQSQHIKRGMVQFYTNLIKYLKNVPEALIKGPFDIDNNGCVAKEVRRLDGL
jgi:hypothetical protein